MDQQSLFNVSPPQWQLDDQGDWLAARIAFANAPFGPYDYSIPNDLEAQVKLGVRVGVPLGRSNRKMSGYCIDIINPQHPDASSVNPAKLKPIANVIDAKPLINASLLKLAKWISEYYLCPIGQVIETIVPTGVRNQSGTREMLFLSLADDVIKNIGSLKLSELQKSIIYTLCLLYTSPSPRDRG